MKLKSLILRNSIYLGTVLLLLGGCGLVSTSTGCSFPPEIQTFSIEQFGSEVAEGSPNLAENLIDILEKKIENISRLTRVEKGGDIQFMGVIKRYSLDTVYSNFSDKDGNSDTLKEKEIKRLTIVVEVSYVNPSDEDASFDKKSFEAHEDGGAIESKTNETVLEEKVLSELVEKIVNNAMDYWELN